MFLEMREDLKIRIMAGLLLLFAGYTLFIYALPQQNDPADLMEVRAGKMIWQQKNCTACHQIYGLGGFLGPDLTNIYSDKTKGPAYIRAYVQGGNAIMPAFQLQDREMSALLAYLQQVDASGKADPKSFKVNGDGTIERK